MEYVGLILADWEALRPELRAVLPESRLQQVLDRADARINAASATTAAAQQRDARSLLVAGSSSGQLEGAPLFVRMLRLDSLRDALLMDGEQSLAGGRAVHFLRFWQAMQELFRRLNSTSEQKDEEPLAEEMAALRDAILRRAESPGSLSGAWLQEQVAAARAMSADEAAWVPLEQAVAPLGETRGSDSHCEEGPAGPGNEKRRRRQLSLEEATLPLMTWLRDMAEDYGSGCRAAKVQAVRDVAGCSLREACFDLGAQGWDVEAALVRHFGGQNPVGEARPSTGSGWSTHGAKLRRSE
ncbi:unnamed protein product, partial [Polarella glacialis]